MELRVCRTTTSDTTTSITWWTETDYVGLVDNLRNTEAIVNPVGEITQPFFSVKSFVSNVNGEDVQVLI